MKRKYSSILAALALGLGFCACSLTGEETDIDSGGEEIETGELSLALDKTIILADGESSARLIVKIGDKEVTDFDAVSVYQVDKDEKNVPIKVPGLVFTTKTPGSYTFWVSYKSKLSNKVSLVAVSPSLDIPGIPSDPDPTNLDFRKRVLITQFTGTGCGYCPNMIQLLRKFRDQDNYQGKTVLAACHTYNQTDPMYLKDYTAIAKNVSGYPSVMLDLKSSTITTTPALSTFNKMVDNEYSVKALAGICATSVAEGLQFVVNAGIKVSEAGKYYIAAWLLEDGIEAKQSNYGTLGDFSVHDNAVRDILGYNASKGDFKGFEYSVEAGEVVTHEFQFTLKEDWKLENCHVVVYVCALDGAIYTVNNVIDIRPN
ncbi:MAG: Omp28-related outer membrane protein, partial [Candidatus Cryptobacteroides sp.]